MIPGYGHQKTRLLGVRVRSKAVVIGGQKIDQTGRYCYWHITMEPVAQKKRVIRKKIAPAPTNTMVQTAPQATEEPAVVGLNLLEYRDE
jgi:hypothetical protein